MNRVLAFIARGRSGDDLRVFYGRGASEAAVHCVT